jgi:hypothetical protein
VLFTGCCDHAAAIENSLGVTAKLASAITDPRNPVLISHSVADILRARMLAIACGYEDADDLDHLRTDRGFKFACGRLSDSERQQLSLFDAHCDERCFLPIHVYDTAKSRPVAVLLRPASHRLVRKSATIFVVWRAVSASIGRTRD